jgi:hypothetical protein
MGIRVAPVFTCVLEGGGEGQKRVKGWGDGSMDTEQVFLSMSLECVCVYSRHGMGGESTGLQSCCLCQQGLA